MTEPTSTKRFVNSLTKAGYTNGRSVWLIPALDGSLWFVDLKRGKRHDCGYLVHTGIAITPEDVVEKMEFRDRDDVLIQGLIESYIIELSRFRIGNVVGVEASDGKQVRLRLIAPVAKSPTGPRLPG